VLPTYWWLNFWIFLNHYLKHISGSLTVGSWG